jgi:hypothetical protein
MYSVMAFLAYLSLFNILYFFVVLPRLRQTGQEVGFLALVNGFQQRYVNAYLETLNESDKRKWYNVILTHPFASAVLAWMLGMIALVAMRAA